MWKFIAFLLVLSVGFQFNVQAGSIPNSRAPRLKSAAFLVQDQQTGERLMSKRAEVSMPIASITKLMTAMVVLDARLDMDAIISIEEQDKDSLRHSQSRLPVGTFLSRREALILSLMASENRAAHALARTHPGGVDAFVQAMNDKARLLNLHATRFADPTGLSDENISSAQDLGRMVDASSRYQQICNYSTQTEYTLERGRKRIRFANTNALVKNAHWQISLSKTGYIEDSGRCLVMRAQLAQKSVLVVLLNSAGRNARLADASRIKQWLEGPASSKTKKKRKR